MAAADEEDADLAVRLIAEDKPLPTLPGNVRGPKGMTRIDKKAVMALFEQQNSLQIVADSLGLDKEKLAERWARAIAKAKAEGQIKLRQWQWDVASDTENKYRATMLIFLGKNYLNQSDNTVKDLLAGDGNFIINIGQRVSIKTKDDEPVVVADVRATNT